MHICTDPGIAESYEHIMYIKINVVCTKISKQQSVSGIREYMFKRDEDGWLHSGKMCCWQTLSEAVFILCFKPTVWVQYIMPSHTWYDATDPIRSYSSGCYYLALTVVYQSFLVNKGIFCYVGHCNCNLLKPAPGHTAGWQETLSCHPLQKVGSRWTPVNNA